MEFNKKFYNGRPYIEYSDAVQELLFTNAEYFVFDVLSNTFKNIMECVGGFVANMTVRYIKKEQPNTAKIMLCSVPQEYNDYEFLFVYLDKEGNILSSMKDNNYVDYEYFKNKFKDCIIDEGFIFALENNEKLSEITKQFHNDPSTSFRIIVEQKEICWEDKIICKDLALSIFNETAKEVFKKIKASHILIEFDSNNLSSIHAKCTIIKEDSTAALTYQILTGCTSLEEYIEHQKKSIQEYTVNDMPEYLNEVYHFPLSINTLRALVAIPNTIFFNKGE